LTAVPAFARLPESNDGTANPAVVAAAARNSARRLKMIESGTSRSFSGWAKPRRTSANQLPNLHRAASDVTMGMPGHGGMM